MVLHIGNRDARRLWIDTNGLSPRPLEPLDVMATIRRLGFVQLDAIQNVSRAHHHILWSRHPQYRETMLDELFRPTRQIFEHFTHDAAIIPIEYFPMWTRRFRKLKAKLDASSYHDAKLVRDWSGTLIERISAEGALSTKDFHSEVKTKKVWSRPPHKRVLDYLWYTGELTTSHRERFGKFYDLPERVIPEQYRKARVPDAEQVDWLCRNALQRLAFGTTKEIKDFWDATDIKEVRDWIAAKASSVIPIKWETASGDWVSSYALDDLEERLRNLAPTSSRVKILNPFDPATRNRVRLRNIFGFDYKLEVFVPAAKRRWGYYVYPLLEGGGFVGRIEVKADRKTGCLDVIGFWPEKGVKWGNTRTKRLEKELSRFARFANLATVNWP